MFIYINNILIEFRELSMNYPDDKRTDYIDEVDQTHSVILRILKIIDIICKKYDIGYWLDYGTLLGAVRHTGFIPWDHEADIGMIRSDFEKFTKVIAQELPADLFYQTRDTDPHFRVYNIIEAKIRDRYSDYIDDYEIYDGLKWHNGIQVDIFVYDLTNLEPYTLTNGFERYYSHGIINLSYEEIEYTIDTKFGDYMFPIPLGYKSYLKKAYGDYMKLPPLENRRFPRVNVFKPCNHVESRYWRSI